jgi:hypothetical protein
MKATVIFFAVVAFVAGLIAAYHWYKSTTINPPPLDMLRVHVRDKSTGLTPLEAWLKTVAERNRSAAGWTVAAVVFGAISNIVSAIFLA